MRWSKFDVGIAAFAAASACFVAYAIPDWRLFQLIFTLRLNDIVPALNPPLGNTIRMAAMAGSALIVFGLVFALMRLLDRVPSRRSASEPVPEVLRLRRADAHPDAPARRPLLAGRELGEPEPAEAAPDTAAPPVPAPEPAIPEFLAVRQPEEAVEDAAEAEPEAEPLDLTAPEADAEPLELTEPAPVAALPEPAAPEPVVPEPVAIAPEPVAVVPEPAAAAPQAEPEPRPETGKAESAEEDEEAEESEESLSKLMRRLESGIGRREAEPARPVRAKEQALPAAPAAEEAPAAAPDFVPPARNRLRSAIQDLEKLAGSR